MWLLLIFCILLISYLLWIFRKKIRVLKPNNFNPPRKELPIDSYIIEAYCRDKHGKLFFVTLNYPTWEQACKTRNEMVGYDLLSIEYNNTVHQYTVLSTKISRVTK